ncbi:hypothetical protein ZYGR_0R00330 [Zygosaccharomyces rouxii]|uniref:ZYRO0F00748p n=2 Tax=Zygosaccharomyces rouxii TaxID=4956 RepID=C5DWY8_ZYGRC|nr:uncharacterized protein ZYRO0F00748g [Zygosaccharomyces rouxii]KAH9199064.1 SRF-type transcription factor (DNA-binding and dimerization domain)-domain-containing protein [Zygosaccharomyces rouxii]GAV49792.1 hypothetical protein ZYGR_0R00330 [Zygosaccharomyces rouxii]CAR28299.1 ZYRO0F00748p [Zygosaccharomyces rouxii]
MDEERNRTPASVDTQEPDDDEDEEERNSSQQKRKYPIKYIENRTRRHVTFAKRRHGIMKKAYELSVLTGANVLLLILSNNGLVYTFTTPKLEPVVREREGKELVWKCLDGRPTP